MEEGPSEGPACLAQGTGRRPPPLDIPEPFPATFSLLSGPSHTAKSPMNQEPTGVGTGKWTSDHPHPNFIFRSRGREKATPMSVHPVSRCGHSTGHSAVLPGHKLRLCLGGGIKESDPAGSARGRQAGPGWMFI